MTRLALCLLLLATLAGCQGEAESTTRAGSDFKVDRLFKVDGCTVYRFHDGSRARYFTNCAGSTQWEESCGKNCSQESGVTGGNHQAGNQRQLSPHEQQDNGPTPALAPGRWIDERYQM